MRPVSNVAYHFEGDTGIGTLPDGTRFLFDTDLFDRIRDTKWYRNYRKPGSRKLYLVDRNFEKYSDIITLVAGPVNEELKLAAEKADGSASADSKTESSTEPAESGSKTASGTDASESKTEQTERTGEETGSAKKKGAGEETGSAKKKSAGAEAGSAKAGEQTTNLADYITDATIVIDGTTYGAGETWSVHEGTDYVLTLKFREKGSLQFPQGGEEMVMEPADLSGMTLIPGQFGTFEIPMGLYGTVTGNQWWVDSNGKLHIQFGEDPDHLLDRSNNTHFEIEFNVEFSGTDGHIKFNDTVTRDWEANTETAVSIKKSGHYNAETGHDPCTYYSRRWNSSLFNHGVSRGYFRSLFYHRGFRCRFRNTAFDRQWLAAYAVLD